jgi:hypothetical protein
VLNHRINGLDLTAWSPSHLMLYLGTGIMQAGVLLGWLKLSLPGRIRTLFLVGFWAFFLENTFFANGHQEYGILGLRAWERGAPEAEPSLLEFAARQIGHPVDRAAVLHVTLPIQDWVYPLWGIGVMALILALARRTVGRAWTATIIAGLYVGYRALIWPLLLGTGFPVSTVPFYLVFVGVAVDLAFRFGRLAPLAGGILVTALGYGALYLQSRLNIARRSPTGPCRSASPLSRSPGTQ